MPPLSLCRDDDGAMGKADDCSEKVDACRPKTIKVDGGDVVRPKSLEWFSGRDGGGYFTGGEFHCLMLEPVEMSDGDRPALEVVGGCGMNCRLNNFAHFCASQTGSLSGARGCPKSPLTVLHSKETPYPS